MLRALSICVLLVIASAASARVPGPLVNAQWLAANRGGVTILDVRSETDTFAKEGHVPGSVLVDWKDVRTRTSEDGEALDDMLPTAAHFAALMRRSGVKAGASIVISSRGLDPDDIFMATRLLWQLRYFGHDDVAVLDGGAAAWAAASETIERKSRGRIAQGDWSVTAERQELLARTGDVLGAIQSKAVALADARPIRDYLGLERDEKVSGQGHIPGAKHFDSSLFLLSARPALFRPLGEIKELAEGLGLVAGKPAITYCSTGDWASGAWFVLHELLGNKAVKLYDGSMHAWTKSMSRPRTRYRLE